MSDAKVQEKLVARLRAFAKLDGNRLCADCSEKVRSIFCVPAIVSPIVGDCLYRVVNDEGVQVGAWL